MAALFGEAIFFVFHAVRFQGLFATTVVIIGGAVLGGGVLSPWADRLWQRFKNVAGNPRRAAAVVAVVALTAIVAVRISDLVSNRYYLRTPYQFALFGPGESTWFPEDAASFLLREHLPANVFNDFNIGGFVTWRLSPQYPDYIDGRGGPFSDIFLHSFALLTKSLDSPEWRQEAASRNINTLMLSVDHELGGGLQPLATYCQSQNWKPVYLDTHAAIFVRRAPGTEDLLRRLAVDCNQVHFDHPPPGNGSRARAQRFNYYLNAGAILAALNRNAEALEALQRAERIFSQDSFLHYAKGAALESSGDWSHAEQELLIALKLSPDDNVVIALSRLYDQQGRYADEARVLSRAVRRSSQPHFLYVKLGYAQLAMGEPRQALHSFDEAEKKSPFAGDAYGLGSSFRSQLAEGRRLAEQALH